VAIGTSFLLSCGHCLGGESDGTDQVAKAECPTLDDLGPETAAAAQCLLDPRNRHRFQMATRLAEEKPAEDNRPYGEPLADKIVERYARGKKVSPRLVGSENHVVLALQEVERFAFDKRNFVPRAADFRLTEEAVAQ
jgi:hypothetical protein